jgi:hypothetical protein
MSDDCEVEDYEEVTGAFMFTDIVSSSKMGKKHGDKKMSKAVCEHYKRMYRIVNQYMGVVIKTVGDEFVIVFKFDRMELTEVINVLKCAIHIQTDLLKNPIVIGGNDILRIRTGIGFGTAKKIEMISQRIVKKPKILPNIRKFIKNKRTRQETVKRIPGTNKYIESFYLDDYLGNVLNIASRMESVVAEPLKMKGGIAFTFEELKNLNNDEYNYKFKEMFGKLKEFSRNNGMVSKINTVTYDKSACGYMNLFKLPTKEIKECVDKLHAGEDPVVAFTIEFENDFLIT